MSSRSSIAIRPDIHARFLALVARADAKSRGNEPSDADSPPTIARPESPLAGHQDDDQAA
jgi:hypothetical protein